MHSPLHYSGLFPSDERPADMVLTVNLKVPYFRIGVNTIVTFQPLILMPLPFTMTDIQHDYSILAEQYDDGSSSHVDEFNNVCQTLSYIKF